MSDRFCPKCTCKLREQFGASAVSDNLYWCKNDHKWKRVISASSQFGEQRAKS